MAKLPKHHRIGRARSILSATAIAACVALLVLTGLRLWQMEIPLDWWLPVAVIAGMATMDFVSGLVHWAADTWGSERLAVIGRRVLHPFRVHHVNPNDILERRFVDTNGDTALLVLPLLIIANGLHLDSRADAFVVVFLCAFSAMGMFTNQVHQWAHQPDVPAAVRALQSCRLILSHDAHSRHHQTPHNTHYCITTGWCNQPLAAIGFFSGLEWLVSRLTGLQPRRDDVVFRGKLHEQ